MLTLKVNSSRKGTEKVVFLSGKKLVQDWPDTMEFNIHVFNDQSYVGSTKLLDFCPQRVRMGQSSSQ